MATSPIIGIPVSIGGVKVSMPAPLPRISVSGKNLIRRGKPFRVWGFHTTIPAEGGVLDLTDASMREPAVYEAQQTARLGTNIMRIFTQMFDFISGPDKNSLVFNQTSLGNLLYWFDELRRQGIYVKLCAANVWTPSDAPAWFDALNYPDRWDVQEYFLTQLVRGIVAAGHGSTVLVYDLVGEPVIKTDPEYPWYGYESYPGIPGVSGQYYNPCIARGPEVTNQTARDWIIQLTSAIKKEDPQALCTVGTLPVVSGAFGRDNTQDLLDILSPHIYPTALENSFGETQLEQAQGWAASTKPVIDGEYYSWDRPEVVTELMDEMVASFNGVISWNGNKFPEEYEISENTDLYTQLLEAIVVFNTEIMLSYRDRFFAAND